MNKKIYIACTFGLLLMLTGCDSFLDITPTGTVIPESAKEYREMLTTAYKSVQTDRGLTSFRSDEIEMTVAGKTSTAFDKAVADQNAYLDIWRWNDLSPANTTIGFSWQRTYYVIFLANYTIESRNRITGGNAAEINQLVGEAYMLRAYMHFLLVNLYGEPYTACDPSTSKAIPLKFDTDTENVLSRNTVGEVYASILSDIDEAEKLLNVETWEKGLTYRFNTLSVDALRSRVYLYMGEWEKSLAASEALLARKNELSDLRTGRPVLPNHYTSVEAIVSLEQIMTSSYTGVGKVSPSLIALYKTGDQRKTRYYTENPADFFTVVKGGSVDYRCTFRTGEIYLNAAEAALKAGNRPDAEKYLFTLMETRYRASNYPAVKAGIEALDDQAFLEELWNERFRELAFEGHRWFDLRRTVRPRLVKNGTIVENDALTDITVTLDPNDVRYTLRIPREAIENNPNLAN